MSLFGALTTSISGLTAQSSALAYISDNIANSQSVGYKRVDATFINYLTESSLTTHQSGTVIARPDYKNGTQGSIQQSNDPLSLAIGGQGLFSVAAAEPGGTGELTFDDRQFYTRAGNFRTEANGYLVNGTGYYLQGWPIDATTNEPDRTTLAPIQVNQQVFAPIATTEIVFSANLPVSEPETTPVAQVKIYDSLGASHVVNLSFTRDAANIWTMDIEVPDAVTTDAGSVTMNFGIAGTLGTPDGTLTGFSASTGTVTTATAVAGDDATITFDADFGQGVQTVTMNLGAFGEAAGVTQFEAAAFSIRSQSQNGVPIGGYTGLEIRDNGDVAVNYDNGQSRLIARVPLVAFPDPDKLQRLDGQAFMQTIESGEARVVDAASDGVGQLVVGAVESSNVDIAKEFTKLIVAQRAYSANTRIVTATDELLQETINMSR
jgi:flagellar hook protein FlgE